MKRRLLVMSIAMALSPSGMTSEGEKEVVTLDKPKEVTLCDKHPWVCPFTTNGNGGGTEPPARKRN